MEPTQAYITQLCQEIHGFVFPDEMYALACYAAQVQAPNVICEIGSYQGLSTTILALFSPLDVLVYSVDIHDIGEGDDYVFCGYDNQKWMEAILRYGLASKVRAVNLKSQAVGKIFDEPIGLLFEDGSHSTQSVRDDLSVWLPHMIPGGIVAFHDMPVTEEARPRSQILKAVEERTDLTYVSQTNMVAFYSYHPKVQTPDFLYGNAPRIMPTDAQVLLDNALAENAELKRLLQQTVAKPQPKKPGRPKKRISA
jgi:MMP 1-O-methyltransferase